jgi:hypothetical protein
VLAERRIGHAKAGADVFAQQFDCSAIGDWVGLREISHRFDQDFLTVYVPGIGGALALLSGEIGRDGDSKNLSHACLTRFSLEAFLQYIGSGRDFQLVSAGSDFLRRSCF